MRADARLSRHFYQTPNPNTCPDSLITLSSVHSDLTSSAGTSGSSRSQAATLSDATTQSGRSSATTQTGSIPPSDSPSSLDPSSRTPRFPAAAIAGIVVGGFIVLLGVVVLLFCRKRRRRRLRPSLTPPRQFLDQQQHNTRREKSVLATVEAPGEAGQPAPPLSERASESPPVSSRIGAETLVERVRLVESRLEALLTLGLPNNAPPGYTPQ
ncbi:hypothetical protein B0H11DRAFT_2253875 [Mycena galericulata]|nr:hypothetical protein B0H11DRAFT_2253875 [Mycena galericulata]